MKNDRPTFKTLAEFKTAEWQSGVPPGFIQEDDWIRQETERYSRLLKELTQNSWFVSWSQKHTVSQSLYGETNGFAVEEDTFLDPDTTRLTDEELRNGGLSTMEQILLQQWTLITQLMVELQLYSIGLEV